MIPSVLSPKEGTVKNQAQQLREELSQISDEQARTDPAQPLQYPDELIDRVLAFVQQQRAQGQSLAQIALDLGLAPGRLHYWLYQRQRRRPASQKAPELALRPVRVSAQMVPVYDCVPERRYILRSPAGWELRELTLAELAELLRSLA